MGRHYYVFLPSSEIHDDWRRWHARNRQRGIRSPCAIAARTWRGAQRFKISVLRHLPANFRTWPLVSRDAGTRLQLPDHGPTMRIGPLTIEEASCIYSP